MSGEIDDCESDSERTNQDAPPPLPPLAPREPPPPPPTPAQSLRKHHVEIRAIHGVAIAALVVLLDYLIYQGRGGFSYSIAFTVLPVVTMAFAFKKIRFAPVAFFVIVFSLVVIRCAWQYGGFLVLTGAILLVTFAIALRLGRVNLPDLLTSLPLTCAMSIAAWPCDLIVGCCKSRRVGIGKLGKLPASTVMIPLLVCAAFAFVFALSNPIIRDMSTHWYSALENGLTEFWQFYGPNPLRIIFWIGCILFVGTLLRPAIQKASEASGWQIEAVVPGSDMGNFDLQYRIALNTLIAINILFAVYNGVDAYHLIIRDALPAGLNHSQYTHQGAFWLTVALVMATFVVGRIFYGEMNFHPKRKTLIIWAAVWLFQNYVLATWVFLRIHMYVGYNGMTRMRIVALVGTSLVVIGLVLVTIKATRMRSLAWLVRKEFGAFLLACIFLAVVPMDYLSWRFNTPNILASDPPRTSVQLIEQPISPEGLATLTPLLAHPDPMIAEGVAALLGRWYFGEGQPYVNEDIELDRWTRYQMGHAWCARVLVGHEDRILALVPDRDWDSKIQALSSYTSRWI